MILIPYSHYPPNVDNFGARAVGPFPLLGISHTISGRFCAGFGLSEGVWCLS